MTDPDFDPPEGFTLDCGTDRALMEPYHVVSQKLSRKGRCSSVHCLRLAWGDTSWPGERRQLEDQEMSTYPQLLRDPRWQKKRLEIFQRDGWACTKCYNENEELHVHHARYFKGKAPWEYPDQLLSTLCDSCHKTAHGVNPKPRKLSFSPVFDEPIRGIVIPWVSGDGYEPYDYLAWTGLKERENDEKYDEIYVCIDRDGNETWIDASCGRAFPFPRNIEVDQATFRQYTTALTPGELVCWMQAAREAVRLQG